METKHIKIDYEKAINSKKQLLSSELNILNIMRAQQTYKLLRKKEFAARNELRINIASFKTKINLIESAFPEQEEAVKKRTTSLIKKSIEKNKKVHADKKKKKDEIQAELDDIRNKLAKLS